MTKLNLLRLSEIFAHNPVLLLFIVASIGYLIGQIKIKGSSLGVSAILFTGLVFGASNDQFMIPEIMFIIGLSIYIYSLGLKSGPAFFKSYQKNGLRDFIFILSMMIFSGLLAVAVWSLFGFSASTITGIYSGSTTNTAALAGVIESLNNSTSLTKEQNISDMVIGYSFSYPMGVLGSMIAIVLVERILKMSYPKEAELLRDDYPVDERLTSKTVEITNPDIVNTTIRSIRNKYQWKIVMGRVYQNGIVKIANNNMTFNIGDVVMLLGRQSELDKAVSTLGHPVKHSLTNDRQKYDVRRIMVSNPDVVGKSIAALRIDDKYNAVVSRIKRGDVEIMADGDTIIELGDRVRVLGTREDLSSLTKFFGDSYEATSRVNLFSFGLGIGLGLLLGSIEFSLGTVDFKLGYAGGPLIVGLILGTLRRTGPIVWTLPHAANITLQQLGLILLLSTIGVRSGQSFIHSLSSEGILIFAGSSLISILTAVAILVIGYRFLKIPFSLLMGMVANQPAILDFATNRTKNQIPNYGYTMMLPIALIAKVLIAQVIFSLLS